MNRFAFLLLLLLSFSVHSGDGQLMTKISKVEAAEELSLPDFQGNMVNLADYKGHYVLINFWAIWCAPCVKEFPAMQVLYDELHDQGFEIIAVHAGPAEAKAGEFLLSKKISFKTVIDEHTSLKGWKVPALPMSYLVDPEGQLVYQAVGSREWDVEEMRSLMTSAIKRKH